MLILTVREQTCHRTACTIARRGQSADLIPGCRIAPTGHTEGMHPPAIALFILLMLIAAGVVTAQSRPADEARLRLVVHDTDTGHQVPKQPNQIQPPATPPTPPGSPGTGPWLLSCPSRSNGHARSTGRTTGRSHASSTWEASCSQGHRSFRVGRGSVRSINRSSLMCRFQHGVKNGWLSMHQESHGG